MEELLSLKESIVTYLDRSGGLRKLVEACQSFKDSQQVYRFSFDVNPSDIVELDAKLGDCVLHDPLKATALFQSVCFLSIKTLSLIEHIHTENQVNVVLLPTHMPPFPSYILDLSEFPRGYYLMRPVALEGLVIAMTCVTKYTQGARFICTEEKCPCSRDELCNAMNIGQLYHVVGIPAHVHQSANITWAIEACRIQNLMPEYPSSISENFQALHAASACSPWRFSAIVANSFGSPVLPPGLYNTLKLVLLLSLVQTKEENLEAHNHLDVLALTGNTLTVERLMTYSLGLAARGIRHTVTGELFASLSRDEHGAGTANIHAGSAFLAAGGVCLLGDLTCYKKDKIDTLQSALDSRAVSVFIPGKKYGEDAEQLLSFPINCNFWALADALTPSKKANRPDSVLLGSVEIGPVPPQLVDAFGLVIQCREPVGNHLLNPMIVHTLRQAISPGEPVYPACMQFTTQDYKELLAYARNLNVGLSTEAEKMIHGYYMASRRVRFSGSVTSMKVLLALAEAHAKLNLRSIVLEEDAVIAVLLCENSITLRHGASTLVIPPDAVFPCDLCDLESLHRRDLTLKEFHQQILQFVYNYAPGAANYIMEE
ncbi:minichromosome maintenance domain-containing protein 2 isoform X3 [Silurus meridionalis]|uniref:minichromosome maintenance domain-containing protein 2 isoform X3 n=1 Tax=Silurus meridionalis TaxID=175797 RepID=UPI001EEAE33E|nr:minichromosome maintenance domain-containing protein 2 isoform X3 [Silurus meridionalis]